MLNSKDTFRFYDLEEEVYKTIYEITTFDNIDMNSVFQYLDVITERPNDKIMELLKYSLIDNFNFNEDDIELKIQMSHYQCKYYNLINTHKSCCECETSKLELIAKNDLKWNEVI